MAIIRWAFASHQPWAHEKAHKTKGGKIVRYRRLPASKHSGHKGARGPKVGGRKRKRKRSRKKTAR